MKKIVVFLLFLLVFGTLSAWDEFNQYSIADELRKPGVKLVAVDFYATWCEPCNAAIPKWKKLQEKYGDKGFKLIVVSVQSEGSCSQPPQWNPDKIVCDYDGDIADAWHANDLPQAFLWSWQGNLLVAHGTVDNVAAAIETYFKKIPRVYVEGGEDENIYKMVRSELIKNSKIEVVASDEERKELAELRKKSTNLNYDTKMQCKLGEEVSANSRLVISTQRRGKKDALVLELFSVEKGCLTASGTATIRGNPEQEVAEAVYNLLKNLFGDVKMPGEGEQTAKSKKAATQNPNFQDVLACEQARSEAKDFAWKAYLKSFPTGACSAEAKAELDKTACSKAEQKNSIDGWKEYLKEFPDGNCAVKAKDEFDKTACRAAEKKNSVDGWKEYLKEYPNGKCAVQAQTAIQKPEAKKSEKAVEKTDEKPVETYRPYKTAGISLIVAGAVVVAAGVAGFHVASDNEYNKYKKFTEYSTAADYVENWSKEGYVDEANKHRDKANTFRALEITSGIVGGAAFVTGIALIAIKKEKPEEKISLTNISFTPSNEGFYASLGFEF